MLAEIWRAYLEQLSAAWPSMLGAGALGLVLYALWRTALRRERERRVAAWAMLAIAALAGTALVVERASVFDDAFISFRYVRNLLDGHGLVWNVGERVEGYTNFLWVMLVAAGSFVSR